MMVKYYAVLYEQEAQIFTTWEECQNYIKGKKGVSYKSFTSLTEAQDYLYGVEEEAPNEPTAYIDGSYLATTKEYSFGGVLIINQKIYQFHKKYAADEYSSARNVAGEIKGAGFIINYAIKNNITILHLYYDYAGIENWYTGKWQARSDIALKYVAFRDQIKDKITIHFHKVKSHTNNKYNDLADTLAKEALGI